MRNVLMLGLLFISIQSYGQIIDTLNLWNELEVLIPTCLEKSTDCSGVQYINHSYRFGTDTIISGKSYKILYDDERSFLYVGKDSLRSNIVGFLRDDENHKKIYFLSTLVEKSEILLYDFTLKKDSIFSIIQIFSFNGDNLTDTLFKSKVTNVDSVSYFGIKRLRITFTKVVGVWLSSDSLKWDTVKWVEGIGSMQGLIGYFYGLYPLLCFKQNNDLMYKNDFGYDCAYQGTIESIEKIKDTKFSIYPNPSRDKIFFISSSNEIKSIKVYTLTGIKIGQYFPNTNQFKIELLNFQSGLYLINVDNKYGKIIIE